MRKAALILSSVAFLGTGCGSDDDGGGGGGGSYDDIASGIESPTGTISSGDDAAAVAEAFGEQNQAAGAGGQRRNGASGEQTIDCTNGGTITVSGSGDGSSGEAHLTYDDCSYAEGCTTNGTGTYYYAAEGGGSYTYCGDYDITAECKGDSLTLSGSYCYGADGIIWLVEANGGTYAVTGSYTPGVGGTWTVTGADGTWECTWTKADGGSCTDGTDTYTW